VLLVGAWPCIAFADSAGDYVYGYPLVWFQRTEHLSRCIRPANVLSNQTSPSTPNGWQQFPNVDTLYSGAWLDFRQGSITLVTPPSSRYYDFQLLDAYTNTVANVTGPGRHQLSSPTPDAWLIGRTWLTDLASTVAFQAGYSLSAGTSPYECSLSVSGQIPYAGQAFYPELAADISLDPAPDAPSAASLANDTAAGVTQGQAQIQAVIRSMPRVNGWVSSVNAGTYGKNYLLRAAVAQYAPGANVPTEELYFLQTGLTGTHTLKLPVSPPAMHWSLTAYDNAGHLFGNSLNRYALSSPVVVASPTQPQDVTTWRRDHVASGAKYLLTHLEALSAFHNRVDATSVARLAVP
jgi:hypothetical protein